MKKKLLSLITLFIVYLNILIPNAVAESHSPVDVFGKISPPPGIKDLGEGSIGISKFLNNLITMIYTLAAVVFIFVLLWAAFEWLSSGGDKEKVAGAQKKITSAIVGIILFSIAFAALNLLGTFTGFTFFQ